MGRRANAGGDVAVAGSDAVTRLSGSGSGYKHWYPTTLVEQWLDGTHANQGVLLKMKPESTSNYMAFYSSDQIDQDKWPKLRVDYMPLAYPEVSELFGASNHAMIMPTCTTSWGANCATGNYFHTAVDLSVPGRGVPLAFARIYNSLANEIDGPLGYGWTHNYNMRLDTTTYMITQENGSTVDFEPVGGGLDAKSHVLASLVDGTYTFTRKTDFISFEFNAAGRLVSQTDPNGYVTNHAVGA